VYVYIQSEPNLWTVGHYEPGGRFVPESDHESIDAATARVARLNGCGGAEESEPFALTLRDQFAASALIALSPGAAGLSHYLKADERLHIANQAYLMADAMLAARAGGK
jgi:hypothetical protein